MTSRAWTIAAAGVGVLAGILATFPLVTHMWDSIATPKPGCSFQTCADHLLHVWVLGEGGRRLYTEPLRLFDANIFHPLRHTLAYSESMLSGAALVAPVNALTGNPIFGYNVYHLAIYALSVLGCFLLVREITGDPRAGLVAGWMFGLAAERRAFGLLLPQMSVQWVPFVLYFWIRFLGAPTPARGVALAAALIAHMHASAYHGLMVPVLLVPWALVMIVLGPWPLRRWALSGAVLGVATALSLLAYVPYLEVGAELGYAPRLHNAAALRTYLTPLVRPGHYLSAVASGRRTTATSTFALPVLLLVVAGLSAVGRRSETPPPRGEGAHLVAALALLLTAMAVSMGNKVVLPLVGEVPMPMSFLRELPGFASMRDARRFTLLAAFGGSVVAGIAVGILLRRIRGRRAGPALVLGLGVLIALDARIVRAPTGLTRLIPPTEVPEVYRWLATTAPDTAVLELPYGAWGHEVRYMLYSLYHRRRLVNGYSAVNPRFTGLLWRFPDQRSIEALQDAGVRHVILHRPSAPDAGNGRQIADIREAGLHYREMGEALVVDIPPRAPDAPAPPGKELEPSAWRLEGSDPGAERAADGDLATHWKVQTRGRETLLRADLGRELRVTGVTLRLGAHIREYPERYQLLVSRDGTTWVPAGGERMTRPPLASYRRDHLDVEVPLVMRPVRARYLEIRVPRSAAFSVPYWGVHEISIFTDDPGRG